MSSTDSAWKLAPYVSSASCAEEFFRRAFIDGGVRYCWATIIALWFILFWHFFLSRKFSLFNFASSSSSSSSSSAASAGSASPAIDSQSGISKLVSDEDLKGLVGKLGEESDGAETWEHAVNKKNDRVSYVAKCCKPKDGGALKYLSVTLFEDCSPEVLRDFYMDNDYRRQWDKTVVQHEQLQVDISSGVEIGRMIKKFPLLTPREYILAWRLWEGKDNSFYCFIKDCKHNLAPQQKKYVRVSYFRSGWRIRKVPGRNACEIKMFHQEDAGINVEMAKLIFSKGIWSYVCKMENALRRYSVTSLRLSLSAVNLTRKVPPELETQTDRSSIESSGLNGSGGVSASETKQKQLLRKPSKKLITNGLILLGGAICLSRGHSSLGAKVAMAYFLTKLGNRGASPNQTRQNAGT